MIRKRALSQRETIIVATGSRFQRILLRQRVIIRLHGGLDTILLLSIIIKKEI